ncbi:MAG: AbrB/MazE/SpoVT family DNA-binding domain-containing protein, partial [Mycolicibacterium frederiksbergense]|nr:AbrB/MazE/SpoVT family DNA-binding domain-containing protein [Mycolicibacterium frederiksbergense]
TQVGRWGNSLAIRIPAAVADALGLKDGDEVRVEAADARTFRIARDTSRDDALESRGIGPGRQVGGPR